MLQTKGRMTMMTAEYLKGFAAAFRAGRLPAPASRGGALDQMPDNA
jgi:hypothetical protein